MQGGYLKTKKVYVFVNGRDNYKSFYIHPKSRMGWNSILAIFSTALKPTFGAIRVLRTTDGRTMIDSFDDLKDEGKYVACGLEPFKSIKGGYRTKSEVEVKTSPAEYYPTKLLSVDEQKKYPCLIETMRKGRTIIFVFANGRKSLPRKVVLIKSDYKIWDNIIIHIGNILDIPEGIKGLCTIFGQPVCSPYEIQHGGYYVAIPCNATFKKIKYLSTKKTDSYHESSPLVTKGAYISASKTCTTLEGLSGKRRKEKSIVRESSEEERLRRSKKDQNETCVDCICVDDEEGASSKKKCIEEDQKEEKSVNTEKSTSEKIYQPGVEESISTSQDVDIAEHQIQSEVYDQNEIFTQTSAVCFESICDQENAIIMNEKKFFLVTEEQLRQMKSSNLDSQPFKFSSESSETSDRRFVPSEEDMDEIREVAGHFVGIITRVSEKMIAKSMYGEDYVSLDSSNSSHENSPDNIAGKVSFISDSLRAKAAASDISEDRMTKSSLSKRSSHVNKDLKSLRLSLPIGRGTSLDENDKNEPEREIIPLKRVSLHSPPIQVSDSLMEELKEEYKPLTPAHDVSAPERESIPRASNSEEEENLSTYIPFFGLRRDSIGIPLISKLYGDRKDSVDEDEDEDETEAEEDAEIDEEENDGADDNDEWKKLDILEDLDLDDKNKVESPTKLKDEEEKHIKLVEEGNGADVTDEVVTEKLETKEKLSQIKTDVEDLAIKKEIIPVQSQIAESEEEETKMTVDNTSQHSDESIPQDEDIKMTEDVASAHSQTSDAYIEGNNASEEIVPEHPRIPIEEIEDAKASEDVTSDHSEILNEDTEEMGLNEDNTAEHLETANAEIEETGTSADMKDRPEIESSMNEDAEAGEDIISEKSAEAGEDIIPEKSAEAGEDIISEKSAEAGEDIISEKSAEAGEDIISEKSAEVTSDVQDLRTSEGSVSETSEKSIEKSIDTEEDRSIDEEKNKVAEDVSPEKSAKVTKSDVSKPQRKEFSRAGQKHLMKKVSDHSLSSTKGSSSNYYGEKDLQAPEKIYGSLLNTSGDIALNEDGSIQGASSTDLPVMTQKSKVGSYCVTLNSWISMKVEECGETPDKNRNSTAGQLKSTKHAKEEKNDQRRNVKNDFEEERRRSLLNFMRMRIELALSNKIPELRQPSESTE